MKSKILLQNKELPSLEEAKRIIDSFAPKCTCKVKGSNKCSFCKGGNDKRKNNK